MGARLGMKRRLHEGGWVGSEKKAMNENGKRKERKKERWMNEKKVEGTKE